MENQAPSPLAKTGSRRNAEQTKQAILLAAQKEIAKQGFSGARIDAIAKSAKCNVRMIYHYFENKKKLYVAVLEYSYTDIRKKELELKIDFEKPIEGILELLKFTFDYFEKNQIFEGILRAENLVGGRFIRRSAHVTESGFSLRKTISNLIESGERQEILRTGIDPVQLYATIAAMSRFHLSSAHTLSAVFDTDITRADWRKARWDHAVAVIRAYLAPPVAVRCVGPSALDTRVTSANEP